MSWRVTGSDSARSTSLTVSNANSCAVITIRRWSAGHVSAAVSRPIQLIRRLAKSTNVAVRSRIAGAPSSTTATAHGRSRDNHAGNSSQERARRSAASGCADCPPTSRAAAPAAASRERTAARVRTSRTSSAHTTAISAQ